MYSRWCEGYIRDLSVKGGACLLFVVVSRFGSICRGFLTKEREKNLAVEV